MKKSISILLILGMLLAASVFLGGCGGGDSVAKAEVDVDLTELNSNMVYSEVYNMVYEPGDYTGKTVKMAGLYRGAYDENTGQVYSACLVMDATACCAQGLNFELTGDYEYPGDYPDIDEEIVVVGVYELRQENGYSYPTLTDAVWEKAD